ncbi:MAG: [FeFe] hydrogenase, group A [bacterium]|nr:[FeFe] hydrogenase, group A [bacterium]
MKVIQIDERLCTGCQECVKTCPAYAIEGEHGKPQKINETMCIKCGQCVQTCKSYVSLIDHDLALYEQIKEERGIPASVREPLFAAYNVCHLREVKEALQNPEKKTMVQCAPAVRVAVAEDFGMPLGTLAPGKLAAALRRLGFDYVYDTDFAADLTIMEEGTELIRRVTEGGVLPMFTSCCPAWVQFIERTYPELTDHLSSCKSPQQMQGAVQKTYGANQNGLNPADIYSVSVMPCTSKEFECSRPEMQDSGYQDVDVVLTTRELVWLIKEQGIDFDALPEETFDQPLGDYTGAGVIFGVTGGVMEAAIRTGYELITGQQIPCVDVTDVRGTKGHRTAKVQAGDLTLKVGIISGLTDIIEVLEQVAKGTCDLHFIEVMTCPEGCVSGGGQPKLLLDADRVEAYANRRAAILSYDEKLPLRKSHENPSIQKLYADYLEKPNSEKAHHLLHTTYRKGGQ